MSRYIVYGAGAVGGLIGARLFQAGHDVTLIARGAHLETMRRNGLVIRTANGSETVRTPLAENLAGMAIGADDRLILAVKTQDAAPVLDEIASVADPSVAIVCAQNGIEGERMALRRFSNAYGVYIFCNAVMVDPGIVRSFTGDCEAILDLGRYPSGNDARATEIAAELTLAGFSSRASEDIMYWKRAKLVINTMNAIQAACADSKARREIMELTFAEARQCLMAAGLAFASDEELAARNGDVVFTPIDGTNSPGGSTFQSLARGNTSTEADYFNGEIVLLGRIFGVPTPANCAMQTLMRRMAVDHSAPGAIEAKEIYRFITAASSNAA